MSEQKLWELYQIYRMKQHADRAEGKRYWAGRADMLLIMAKELGYQTSYQPEE